MKAHSKKMESDKKDFMLVALQEANLAASRGEVPIGAVVVHPNTGKIIAASGNRTYENNDPTAHAEILVIRMATQILQSPRLLGYHLFVTLEPCPMCAAAISFARVRRLYIGAYDTKGGGVFHGPRIFEQPTCFHKPDTTIGYHEKASQDLLRNFFSNRRES